MVSSVYLAKKIRPINNNYFDLFGCKLLGYILINKYYIYGSGFVVLSRHNSGPGLSNCDAVINGSRETK